MSKLVVITGVTGNQGSSVANTFLSLPEWRVRGITRNPSGETAQALAAKGVEIVRADIDDKQSLIPAFTGATAIYSNTDFFMHLFEAIGSPPASGVTANEYAYDREVAQGVNIAEAAASPEVLKTLDRFVLSSLCDATKFGGGKYKMVYHFDSKAEMIRVIKSRFPDLAARMSTLQIGHYVTNWKAAPDMAPQKQPDGSFLTLRSVSPDFKVPFIDIEKDTGSFVKALVEVAPGKDLLGVSQYLTFGEWMEVWGKVHGVKGGYKQVSGDEFFKAFPEPLGVELKDSFDFMDEFGFCGGDPNVLTPEQLDVKVPVTPMQDYIKREDWSSVFSS